MLQSSHECICHGEGCNKNWETAGETSEPTTPPPTGAADLRCYVCEHGLPGDDCDADHPGTLETCPMGDNKGCRISQYEDQNTGESYYTRGCSGKDEYKCDDYEGGEGGDYHECVCEGEGCNKNWDTAGDNQETTTNNNQELQVQQQ